MRDIGEKLGVSLNSVVYFMRRHNIARRMPDQNSAILFARKAPSFIPKNKLSAKDEKLKMIGIVLYWCEGYKSGDKGTVDFANSDPVMIGIFMHFLRKICGVDEKRIRIYLYCYANQNTNTLLRFWHSVTGIPYSQFTKPYVREDFREDKRGKMKYGLVHVRYADKKLRLLVLRWIDDLKNKCVGGGVANRTAL